VIHFRSSSWLSLDSIHFRAFSFSAHYHNFWLQQRKVVWNPLLQDDSEGPTLIDYTVTQTSRLSPTRLLVAHLEKDLHGKLAGSRPAHLIERIQASQPLIEHRGRFAKVSICESPLW
jgi:hypothetical protein